MAHDLDVFSSYRCGIARWRLKQHLLNLRHLMCVLKQIYLAQIS